MKTLADIRAEARALDAILSAAPILRTGYTHGERPVVELDHDLVVRVTQLLRSVDRAIQTRVPA